jgi:hypothetical protein
MAKKKNDETITSMEYLFKQTVNASAPFNWKLYRLLEGNGEKDKRNQEAVLFFGYLVAWQSLLTEIKRLRRGGYFFRSRPHITGDIGLTKQAQQKAEQVLMSIGLISVKYQPGQSNHYKVDIDRSLKIIDRAQKVYATRFDNDGEPGPEVTTNNINNNDYNNVEGEGFAFQKTEMQPLSFYDYKKQYIGNDTDTTDSIEHFLQRHAQVIGPGKHKLLKAVTWSNIVDTLEVVDDDGREVVIEYDDLKTMIDLYFDKATKGKYKARDYGIAHFNNPGIKKILYHERYGFEYDHDNNQ